MGVTTVTIGGLDVHDGAKYATAAETLEQLEALSPREPVMVDMANRHPVYVRSQIQARPVSLTVFLLDVSALQRKLDYDDLLAVLNTPVLVPLVWIDTTGAPITKTLMVHASSLIASRWFSRCNAELISPNPEPTVT